MTYRGLKDGNMTFSAIAPSALGVVGGVAALLQSAR
jgi:hypothetical protein